MIFKLASCLSTKQELGHPPTYSPEVVDQDIENAQNDNQQSGAKLGLEAHHNHDTSQQSEQADNDSPDTPVTAEHEANEQEDQQHSAGKLEVHLAILLLELRETGKGLRLAHPRVRQNHQQTAHDRQVAQEEVEVEDEAVAERLGDDDADQAGHGVLRVPASDYEDGAGEHGDHIDDEEEVRDAAGDWSASVSKDLFGGMNTETVRQPTVAVVVQIQELVAPLCDYSEGVFEEGDDNQEAPNCREIAAQ